MKLSNMADVLKMERLGADCEVERVVPLEQAATGDLSFVINAQWLEKSTSATALIIQKSLVPLIRDQSCLISTHPALDAARAAELLGMRPFELEPGVHPLAVIHPGARLGKGVRVGPGAHIGDRVTIGDASAIHAGAVILADTIIGTRCVIQANAVIGSDGFGYEWVQDRHVKIPHFGHVIIGDDVEIGACTTIDRGRFGATTIGNGTKIDNQVQIAHNCQIGNGCIIVAQVGISGSCHIKDHAVLAGQAGVIPHITIGERAIIAAGTGVAEDVPAGSTWSGWWGQNHRDNKIQIVLMRKLPELVKKMRSFMDNAEKNNPGTSGQK
ncbi:MAG: UDP-3-O-(3-hydroxymyristoyl)glucosamine N-acyltransferase [Magnetococcales bacterium]|nr:UDP-3-O-(3-hydroxymyristoyl)glucosamine N-acyltransferase [Magnetococcales bacterium]